jgi:hypothetical protein
VLLLLLSCWRRCRAELQLTIGKTWCCTQGVTNVLFAAETDAVSAHGWQEVPGCRQDRFLKQLQTDDWARQLHLHVVLQSTVPCCLLALQQDKQSVPTFIT